MNKTIQKRQERERTSLLSHLRKTPIIQLACEKTGVGRATYYRWRKEDKVFAKEADKALAEGIALMNDFAESQLIASIRDRNMTAIIYWLKHRHKSYSTKVELTGEVKAELGKLTTEQERLISKAIDLVVSKGKDV